MILIFGCDFSIDLSEKEARYKTLEIYDFIGIGHPWVLHTWENGTRFELVSVSLVCSRGDVFTSVDLVGNYLGPDGSPEGGGGVSIEATCTLVGSDDILFSFPGTEETLLAKGVPISDGCLTSTVQLPSNDLIRSGDSQSRGIPEEIEFPDPMPQGRFRTRGCF